MKIKDLPPKMNLGGTGLPETTQTTAMKLINTHKDYLLLVDEDVIEQNTLAYNKGSGIAFTGTIPAIGDYKIVAHLPLHDNAPVLEGVLLLPELENEDLKRVEQVILKISPQLADIAYRDGGINPLSKRVATEILASQNRRYTEEDMEKAYETGVKRGDWLNIPAHNQHRVAEPLSWANFIHSLSPVTLPVGFEPEYDKSPLEEMMPEMVGRLQFSQFKTIKSTFRGKEVEQLIGGYVYGN